CYYGKRCYQVGSEAVRHKVVNCHHLICTNQNGIIKFVHTKWGCNYRNRCYKVGSEVVTYGVKHCNFLKCTDQNGTIKFKHSRSGCQLPHTKRCIDCNSTYQTSCVNYSCLRDKRTAKAKLNTIHTGCFYRKRCYQVGSKVVKHNVNNCQFVKCTNKNGTIKFRHVTWGCYNVESCYPLGSEVARHDVQRCDFLKCTDQNGTIEFRHSRWGCQLPQEKKCLDHNSTYKTSCENYTCLWDSHTAKMKLHKTFTGCYYDKRCYQVGSEVAKHNVNNCHYLKCTNQNSVIKFRQSRSGCIYEKRCYQVGSEVVRLNPIHCQFLKCIDQNGTIKLIPSRLGCYHRNRCYAVGSLIRTIERHLCHLKKCTVEDGTRKVKHYEWECLYKGQCFKLKDRIEIESYCATMTCLNGLEERRKFRYMPNPLPAQFILLEHKCKDMNGNCVPKDSKFSVIRDGKRHDNCSCTVVEDRYSSHALKTQGFKLEVLHSSKFVYVRKDSHKHPLQRPYDGPYLVLDKSDKFFTVDIKGRPETISIDRLKAAFVTQVTTAGDTDRPPEPPSAEPQANSPPQPFLPTSSPPMDNLVTKTRSGRSIRLPSRFR
ncbi:pro-pol polyprotein, partial [Plakobranchus ocellatus]